MIMHQLPDLALRAKRPRDSCPCPRELHTVEMETVEREGVCVCVCLCWEAGFLLFFFF